MRQVIFYFRIVVNHELLMCDFPSSFIDDSSPYFILSEVLSFDMMKLMIFFFQMVGIR
jgi:hypothetical protein